MNGKLPINLDDLLHQRTIEGGRFKVKDRTSFMTRLPTHERAESSAAEQGTEQVTEQAIPQVTPASHPPSSGTIENRRQRKHARGADGSGKASRIQFALEAHRSKWIPASAGMTAHRHVPWKAIDP